MRKEMYLIRGTYAEDYESFTRRILALAKEACNVKPVAVKLTVTTRRPPALTIIPFKKGKISVISVYKKDHAPVSCLTGADGFAGAWVVEEAVPVAYEKTWPDGVRIPGVSLLTLFNRKPGINYPAFLHRWYNGHTPLSLKIHPLWNYNRNAVKDPLAPAVWSFEGIVEEHFRTQSDLLNIFKFFGNPSIILYRLYKVYSDTNSFLDYQKIETYLADEYHLLSGTG